MTDSNRGPDVDPCGDVVSGWDPTSMAGHRASGGHDGPEARSVLGWTDRSVGDFSLHLDSASRSLIQGTAGSRARPDETIEGASGVSPFPQPGQVLAGFRLVHELGRGAFGRVYLAQQAELADRPVAVKVSRALGDEPQALARLQHTHIVPIHSVHDDAATGLRVLCMPYFGGANLAQVLGTAGPRQPTQATGRSLIEALDRLGGPASMQALPSRIGPASGRSCTPGGLGRAATRGVGSPSVVRSLWGRQWARLPWWGRLEQGPAPGGEAAEPGQPARQFLRSHTYVQAAVWIAARLAEALEHAHARGILHRDLKPSNILIAADGTPMLLDFNLSADAHGPREGEKAMIGGTLPYMAPEHLDAFDPAGTTPPEAVDERSDLYALGLILFEMVAGHHPFDDPPAGVPLALAVRQLAAQRLRGAPSARASNPLVPPSLDAILAKCLDPEPDRRYADAGQFAEDLRRFLDDRPLKFTREPSLRERLAKWARRHPEARSASAVGGLAAALILGFAALAWTVADRLEVASARVHRADFLATFNRCQLRLNTASGPAEHLRPGIEEGYRVLHAYGVDRSADWVKGALVRRLPPDQQRALREEMSELVLLRTRALVIEARRGTESDRRRALEDGVAWLDRAETFDPRPSAALYEERAQYYRALGLADLAARDRARAARIAPATGRDFYLLGTSLLARGRPELAEPHLSRAVALDAGRFWAWFALGLCHHDQGRYAEAAADFAVCTVLSPDFAWPHLNRGLSLAAAGRLTEARAAYDHALAISPTFREARVDRALTCLELGDPAQALKDLDRAVVLGKPDASILAARAEALARLGRRDEAERGFAEALAVRPDDPALRVARGFSRLVPDPAGARADFERALARDPRNARALLGLAHLLRRSDPRVALARVEAALAADPRLADALQLRALIRAHLGDPAAAEDADRLAQTPTAYRLYNAACALSVLSRTTSDPRLAPRALGLLRRALDAGFPASRVAVDPDLVPLRALPGWKSLGL
jgi:eukaryotic-like serine/threonine-protein kinase